MAKCKWCVDEICVNADCPMCADYCPVPNDEGVCRYEDTHTKRKRWGEVKTVLYIIGVIAFFVLAFSLSYWIFNAVVNSDLSPFWKWVFLH